MAGASMKYLAGEVKEEESFEVGASSSSGPAGSGGGGGGMSESFPEVSLLPLVHDILHTVEKDTQDLSKKNEDSLLAAQKVQQLNKKFR